MCNSFSFFQKLNSKHNETNPLWLEELINPSGSQPSDFIARFLKGDMLLNKRITDWIESNHWIAKLEWQRKLTYRSQWLDAFKKLNKQLDQQKNILDYCFTNNDLLAIHHISRLKEDINNLIDCYNFSKDIQDERISAVMSMSLKASCIKKKLIDHCNKNFTIGIGFETTGCGHVFLLKANENKNIRRIGLNLDGAYSQLFSFRDVVKKQCYSLNIWALISKRNKNRLKAKNINPNEIFSKYLTQLHKDYPGKRFNDDNVFLRVANNSIGLFGTHMDFKSEKEMLCSEFVAWLIHCAIEKTNDELLKANSDFENKKIINSPFTKNNIPGLLPPRVAALLRRKNGLLESPLKGSGLNLDEPKPFIKFPVVFENTLLEICMSPIKFLRAVFEVITFLFKGIIALASSCKSSPKISPSL